MKNSNKELSEVSFKRRAVAYTIDAIWLTLLYMLLGISSYVISILIVFALFAMMIGYGGATLGQYLVEIEVKIEEGNESRWLLYPLLRAIVPAIFLLSDIDIWAGDVRLVRRK